MEEATTSPSPDSTEQPATPPKAVPFASSPLADDPEAEAIVREIEQIKLRSAIDEARMKQLKEALAPSMAIAQVSSLVYGRVRIDNVAPTKQRGAIDPAELTRVYGLSQAEIDACRKPSTPKSGYVAVEIIKEKKPKPGSSKPDATPQTEN